MSTGGERPRLNLKPLSAEQRAKAEAGKAVQDQLKESQITREKQLSEKTAAFHKATINTINWTTAGTKHMSAEGGEDNTAGKTKAEVESLIRNRRDLFYALASSNEYKYVYDVSQRKSVIVIWAFQSTTVLVKHVGPSMA